MRSMLVDYEEVSTIVECANYETEVELTDDVQRIELTLEEHLLQLIFVD